MFFVVTGNSTPSPRNIFLLNFSEFRKAATIYPNTGANNAETRAFIIDTSTPALITLNTAFMDGGGTDIIMGQKVEGFYLVNSRNILKFAVKRKLAAADANAPDALLCHPNCLQPTGDHLLADTLSYCRGIAHDASACHTLTGAVAPAPVSTSYCEATENRERGALRCALRREITRSPLQGTVFTVKDYFPYTFNNFTCTAPEKVFKKDTYVGAWDGSNLIWFLVLGSIAILLLVLALYFMLSSGSGPKYYNPNIQTVNDPYLARQLSPRRETVPGAKGPEFYDDVAIARRNSFMNPQGNMTPNSKNVSPRNNQNRGYTGGTPNRNDRYNDQ